MPLLYYSYILYPANKVDLSCCIDNLHFFISQTVQASPSITFDHLRHPLKIHAINSIIKTSLISFQLAKLLLVASKDISPKPDAYL